MSAKEFSKWITYDSYEPLNSNAIQLAQLALLVSSGLGGKGTFSDFLPGRDVTEEGAAEISVADLNSLIKGMF